MKLSDLIKLRYVCDFGNLQLNKQARGAAVRQSVGLPSMISHVSTFASKNYIESLLAQSFKYHLLTKRPAFGSGSNSRLIYA